MNDARATSLSLPAVKPATVMVHLGRVSVGGLFSEWRMEDCYFGNEIFGDRDVSVMPNFGVGGVGGRKSH